MSRTNELQEWLSSESSPISNFSELSKQTNGTKEMSEVTDEDNTGSVNTDNFSEDENIENSTEFSESEIDEIVNDSVNFSITEFRISKLIKK